MNVRIKKLRKALDLTQQEFATKIGSTQNVLANYESGRRNPSSSVINNICKTFNVSETWLRTGEGEMFVQMVEDPVERLCEELHATELDAEIIRAYFKIDERIRETFMRKLLEQVRAPAVPANADTARKQWTEADASGPQRPTPDVAAELAELKRQNQALAAKVAAMEEEDARMEVAAEFPVGDLSGGTKTG